MSTTGSQYHLKGKGFSGRAVRLKELSPSEVEANLTSTAKTLSGDASIIELKKSEWRNGVKLMIVSFTEPCEDPFAEGVKWRKATGGMLEDLGEYFKAKDVLALEAVYREFHEVIPSELEAITGKALPFQSEG